MKEMIDVSGQLLEYVGGGWSFVAIVRDVEMHGWIREDCVTEISKSLLAAAEWDGGERNEIYH